MQKYPLVSYTLASMKSKPSQVLAPQEQQGQHIYKDQLYPSATVHLLWQDFRIPYICQGLLGQCVLCAPICNFETVENIL